MQNARTNRLYVYGLTPVLFLVHFLTSIAATWFASAILAKLGTPVAQRLVLVLWLCSFPIGWSVVRLVLRFPSWHRCYMELPANAGFFGASRLRWLEAFISHIILGLLYALSSVTGD
jgi:hypothetical protein